MKANVLVIAALAVFAATPAIAQQRSDQVPQRTNLPEGGLTLDFNEIDVNQDRVISVEEWNAFIAKLRERTAQRSNSGGAAAGGTSKGSSSRAAGRERP